MPAEVDFSYIEDLFPLLIGPNMLGDAQLEYVRMAITPHPEHVIVKVKLVIWAQGTIGKIEDIREEDVDFGLAMYFTNRVRVTAFFAALAEVLRGIDHGVLGGVRPSKLIPVDVLTLLTPREHLRFTRALRTKARLGRYLVG
jgi:hypothetical protein